jgi:glycosyltransferase involved in cell wall biosynthesis
MRLLLCIDHFGPGGAQRQLVALARGLHARGHDLGFFVYHPHIRHFAPQVEALGIPVHAVSKAGRFSPWPVLALAGLIRRSRPDGVLAYLPTPAVYAELASLADRRVPVVVSERFMYTRLSPVLRAQQQLHRLASWITVNSHHQRERMERVFPWMRGKVSTIYNGVDLQAFAPPAGDGTAAGAGPLRLLAVASTARKKNALGLVRALGLLRRGGREVPHVAWAGVPTTPDDEAAKAEVDAALAAEGVADRWEWLGKRGDVPELMRRHDALVHPAFFEGLPNAICEALASGLPVLASAVCDHARLVAEDRGLLFDPASPADIAAALERFAATPPERRRAMSRAARAFAERELALERYAREYEDLFARLGERRRARAALEAAS